MSIRVIDGERNAIAGGHERIDATSTVETLTVPTGARAVLLYAETACYFTDDGTDPAAASAGIGLAAGEKFFLGVSNLAAVKVTGGIVRCLYYS